MKDAPENYTSHITEAEYYLTQRYGWDAVNLQFTTFTYQLKDKQRSASPDLENRFDIYAQVLG